MLITLLYYSSYSSKIHKSKHKQEITIQNCCRYRDNKEGRNKNNRSDGQRVNEGCSGGSGGSPRPRAL